MRFLSVVILFIFLINIDGISCNSPPSPVKYILNDSIDCMVTNAYGIFLDRVTYRALEVVLYLSEEEVVEAMVK